MSFLRAASSLIFVTLITAMLKRQCVISILTNRMNRQLSLTVDYGCRISSDAITSADL